jgi:DNA-binding MarR family transcriptional regulator
MSEAGGASPLALRIWDLLTAFYRRREGAQSVSQMMRASDLSRSEIAYGLAELARGGWVERVLTEADGRMIETWSIVVERQERRHGGRDQGVQQAAE